MNRLNLKKGIFFTITLMISFVTFSQTDSERKKIIASYNTESIESLKFVLNEKFKAKEKRVSAFLKTHKKVNRKKTIGNKSYVIYDIQDGKPVYRTTNNIASAKSTRTDKLQQGGSLALNLEGQNMNIGVWDEESALGTHDEFKDNQAIPQSRVIYPEFGNNPFLGTTSAHATHVAGTLIGKGANADAKGMAPKATLRSYDWNNDNTEALTEAGNGLLISNHSYGFPTSNADNIGAYLGNARDWDQIAYAAPYYLPVKSAGNDGTLTYTGGLASGFDKLMSSATAKNALIVADANPTVLGSFINLQISNTSSQGPTDDFRIKPDIAGDGTGVFSSINTNNSAYTTLNGTSMASPNVAGSLLLLQQYYNQLKSNFMTAATLKGLACHTALDDTARTGPDPIFGWGLLDAEAAANTIKDANNGTAVISELSLNNGGTYTYVFSAASGSKLSATICWTDPAGQTSTSPGNVLTPRLVNDLDLRLEDSNNTVFTPWKLNSANVSGPAIKGDNDVDNIERIDIGSPVAGQYTLTVTHKGTITNSSQNFSLIVTGASLTLGANKIASSDVIIWPIPVKNKLNIDLSKLSGKTSLNFYDVQGRLIYEEQTSKRTHSINISKFNSGMYFLNLKNRNQTLTKKIIIK
jgi:hypothetical protein